jgi:L-2-hydroxyglutarate oxidase LhgO
MMVVVVYPCQNKHWSYISIFYSILWIINQYFPFQEFTIALAENAVDNGVELRIRRQVTNVTPTDDYMEVKVRHWEPKEYLAAKEKVEWSTMRLGMVGGASVVAIASAMVASYLPAMVAVLYVLFDLLQIYGTMATVSSSTPLTKLVAMAGQAVGTGGTKVDVEDMKVGGSGSPKIMNGVTVAEERIQAKYVINCAGSFADQIAKMIGDNSFKIKPRVGDYILLNRNQGHLAKHTLFPCPDPILGKGVLVQTTLWGNLILGPTARDMHQPDKANMTAAQIQHYILSKCQQLVPSFDPKETIHAFCGARAKSDRGDWIIENSTADGRMIHVAGIDSPGLAGSPAIALEVVRLLEESGLGLVKNQTFNPRRAPIITPKQAGMRGLKVGPVGKNDSDGTDEAQMAANVICKYVLFVFLVFVFIRYL